MKKSTGNGTLAFRKAKQNKEQNKKSSHLAIVNKHPQANQSNKQRLKNHYEKLEYYLLKA